MASETSQKGRTSELAIWYGFFCLSSVGMQLLNKAIAKAFRERGATTLDNLLMVWQQLAATALNFLCMQFIGGDTWRMNRITAAQVTRLILPSANFVCLLICSLKALKTVHVATVVVARNVCTVFVCLGEAMLFQKYASRTAVLSLFVIVAGSVVYGIGDLTFEPEGYFWQALNSLLFVIGQLYEKWAMGRSAKDQTPLGISTIKNSVSLPVLAGIMMVQGDFQKLMAPGATSMFELPASIWLCILASGAGTCALSICYMTLYKISSATAITVGGNFNKAVSIVAASALFAQPMGSLQCLGLSVCIMGSLWYSLESSKKPAVKSN